MSRRRCPRYDELGAGVFTGVPMGLLHGRMGYAEKEAVMNDFHAGRVKLLVTTTVVEVGVHVPQATIMVIHHPERFGLSQVHQLRGRVGRGGRAGHCFLLLGEGVSQSARERLGCAHEGIGRVQDRRGGPPDPGTGRVLRRAPARGPRFEDRQSALEGPETRRDDKTLCEGPAPSRPPSRWAGRSSSAGATSGTWGPTPWDRPSGELRRPFLGVIVASIRRGMDEKRASGEGAIAKSGEFPVHLISSAGGAGCESEGSRP